MMEALRGTPETGKGRGGGLGRGREVTWRRIQELTTWRALPPAWKKAPGGAFMSSQDTRPGSQVAA